MKSATGRTLSGKFLKIYYSGERLDLLEIYPNDPIVFLRIRDNELRYLSSSGCKRIKKISLKYAPNLKEVYLGRNKLRKIDLKYNKKLRVVSLSYNRLKELNISDLLRLRKLVIAYNPLYSLKLPNKKGLREIDVQSTKLTRLNLLNSNQTITVIKINDTDIKYLDSMDFPRLYSIHYYNTMIKQLRLTNHNLKINDSIKIHPTIIRYGKDGKRYKA